jgi:hypothetical protein
VGLEQQDRCGPANMWGTARYFQSLQVFRMCCVVVGIALAIGWMEQRLRPTFTISLANPLETCVVQTCCACITSNLHHMLIRYKGQQQASIVTALRHHAPPQPAPPCSYAVLPCPVIPCPTSSANMCAFRNSACTACTAPPCLAWPCPALPHMTRP